ncbi:coagulation factor 5/8 type domain-containing protein [Streptomyces sp. ISL-11]|uniref:coagulation factor 5/8 type domain-containing protein n=1 Tax=Streptomyces sp. ISL-11 TaxID=2819174 RepID=UPI0027E3C1C1|nr:coagulation factor 5/8 type domain-containing protein [Streptomyces sp. ISL-11]
MTSTGAWTAALLTATVACLALAQTPGAPPLPSGGPELGPDVRVFDPSMPKEAVQDAVDAVFRRQERAQFGTGRQALLFKPGTYDVDVDTGFYTQVAGLGLSPDDVTIRGAVRAEADWFGGNATQNFWRAAENLSVTPASGADRWAVSQAAPYRRMHLRGDLRLDDGGWSSGGLIADSLIDGTVRSGTQQQWLSRDSEFGGWTGAIWNMVFVGVRNAPPGAFPRPPHTRVDRTPVMREKPFLHVDRAGAYRVFVPALRTGGRGTTWAHGARPAGTSRPLGRFFVVRPGTGAARIDAALARGKDLLFTPGIHHLDRTLRVTRPGTVVLGLGLATLVPDTGRTALSVADVDGVRIAGLLVDAGPAGSPALMEIGPPDARRRHSADPVSLHDVFFRIGGAGAGRATRSLVVNSSDVIGDNLWLWRADHGDGIGWTVNTAAEGLVVNGDRVTMYGLFVEHYQRHQTLWNGEGGRTYFFQNEMPYDPPGQAAWRSGAAQGYPAYKVAAGVTRHEAWGMGSYCSFDADPDIVADRAFEAPRRPGVRFHDLVTVSLGGKGTIRHVINGTGGPADARSGVAQVVSYP